MYLSLREYSSDLESLETEKDLLTSEPVDKLWNNDRFRGWRYIRKFVRSEVVRLKKGFRHIRPATDFHIQVCNHIFRFIMPERIEFYKDISASGKVEYGVIQYTEAERITGLFRFPKNGEYFARPSSPEDYKKNIINLSEDQLKTIINNKKVLTFEAFKIPFFSFEYFYLSKNDLKEIEKIVDEEISTSVRSSYETKLNFYMREVKEKIEKIPNNLFILQNILDLKYTNEKEISVMTDNIIHFGI